MIKLLYKKSFAKLLLVILLFGISTSVNAETQKDEYGGYVDIPIPGARIGHWGTAKIGNRWVLVTPEGNAFINLGVYNLGQGSGKDKTGASYFDYWRKKYTWSASIFCTAQLKRLRDWGFNSIADYAYSHCKGYSKVGRELGNRTPAFTYPINGADYSRRNVNGLIKGHVKELIRPCNGNYKFWGAKVVDYFDSRFAEYIEKRLLLKYKKQLSDPYCIGVSTDEADNLFGFGAGDDWGEGHTNAHLGLIVAVVPPTQDIDPDKKWKYTDTKTYSKHALKNFLQDRYGTIEALNAAWGSNYTTFESDGGWEIGSGFLDEDGRKKHKAWLGTDENLSDGTADPDVKKDLDDFLYALANHYFKTYHDIIKKYFPNVLQVGPGYIGSWGQPPRRQVLRAASQYLDVYRSGLKEPDLREKIDFTVKYLGKEMPMIAWVGTSANADSGLHQYKFNSIRDQPTQEKRGEYYKKNLIDLFMTSSSDGSYMYCGIQLWEWTDHWNEKTNWGLISIKDNAYDGFEAKKRTSLNEEGRMIGGEKKDYGDFITSVREANREVLLTIKNEISKKK